MTKEELQEAMREYIKENLSLSVRVEKYSEGYDDRIKVYVTLSVEGDDFIQSYDYTTL